LAHVAKDRAVVTRTGAKTTCTESPFPGVRPFRRADRNRFFGRASEVAIVADLWRANRLAIVHGRAGSGKTSLLQAGVLPAVESGTADLLPPGLISGGEGTTFPFAALAEHNPYTLALLRSWSPAETPSRLVGVTVQDFIRQRAEHHDRIILAAIDQAEELVADPGSRRPKHQRFLSELAETLDREPRLHLLLWARDEALERLTEVFGNGARHRLTPLRPENAVEALTGPAARAGRRFESAAAEELVADLLTSNITASDGRERAVSLDEVEPALLQAVGSALWTSLPADAHIITTGEVRYFGDADRSLAAHCGRTIAAAADRHGEPVNRLRSWLIRTFITELGTRGSVYEGVTQTARMPNAVVRTLEDLHLLAAEHRSGSVWYELLSDRLTEPLRTASEERPPHVEPAECLRLAKHAQALNELDLAERYATRLLRTPKGMDVRLRAEANSLLGDVAYERGKPPDAEARHRAAASLFEVARDSSAVASQLAAVGQALLAQGELAGAVKELQAAVDRSPNDLLLQTEFGWALWQLGNGRAAVAILNGALSVDGKNPDALRARGEILADLGDPRAALRDLDRVAGDGDDWPSARAARGLALAEIGDRAAASIEISAAIAGAPRNGPVLFYASRAEALGGDKAGAVELARRAVSASDPAMPPHQFEAARVLAGPATGDR
jgi:tetratricopeptide (TPR) repeat protein